MSIPVLVYTRYHTTSYILFHVLQLLLTSFRKETEQFHFHVLLDDRRDRDLALQLLPSERVTVHLQYERLQPFEASRTWQLETIARWEQQYGSPHLRSYILMERALEGRPEETKWRYLLSHIEYFEALCQRIRPVLYVSGAADGLNPWVAMAVAKGNGVPCLSFSPCRFGQRSFILDNPYEVLGIGQAYKDKLLGKASADEMSAARDLMDEYRSKEVRPVDHLAVRAKKRRKVPNPLSALALAYEAFATDTGYFDLPLRKSLARAVRGRCTTLRNALLAGRAVTSLPQDESFFFFPLQFEPEISLGTQGRGWVSQFKLVRHISYSLPIDRWLYIKEHPSMLSGIRPAGFYRALLALPRVRLVSQRMSSYEIFPKAEAVLTITGTAGWEALMHRKPVVLFGHAFYEEFEEGVTKVDNIETLPAVLRGLRDRAVPEGSLQAYVAAVLERAPQGIFIEPRMYPEASELVMSEENLSAIGRVILDRLSLLGEIGMVPS